MEKKKSVTRRRRRGWTTLQRRQDRIQAVTKKETHNRGCNDNRNNRCKNRCSHLERVYAPAAVISHVHTHRVSRQLSPWKVRERKRIREAKRVIHVRMLVTCDSMH